MKLLVMLGVVAFFAVTPVYLYESLVAPELNNLAGQYGQLDETAQDIAAGKSVTAPVQVEIPSFSVSN